ncbi:MAG: ABC transporter ATP-binding protein [Candidatus Saccharibacteria bacterium]|nr:ABC transporter ATP-binding protein [Candidatus Saccharibacteria bacterium]
MFTSLRSYFRLTNPAFFLAFLTSALSKLFRLLCPLCATLIIKSLTTQNPSDAYLYIFLFFGAVILDRLFNFLSLKIGSRTTIKIHQTLSQIYFEKLTTLDPDFLKQYKKGVLINIANVDLLTLSEIFPNLINFLTTFLEILAVFIIVALIAPFYGLIFFIFFLIYFALKFYADKKYNFYWKIDRAENDDYTHLLDQTISGLDEVKSFHLLPDFQSYLKKLQSKFAEAYQSEYAYRALRDSDLPIIAYVFRVILYLILIFEISAGTAGLDRLVFIISYFAHLIDFSDSLLTLSARIRHSLTTLAHVKKILAYKPKNPVRFGTLVTDHLSGKVELKNLSLTLNHQKILDNLNLTIFPHEFIVITGFPGAGKTKLFDLILRLEKPTHGKILLDDKDITRFSREVYAHNVAVATQSPFIFNTTIRKNLDLVDPDIPHQISACKTVGIHDFIESLPNNYHTVIRENATNISGGQRQLISIARTILTDAEILLFDDITTSLDSETLKLIPKMIKNLKPSHTIIMITKKPDFFKLADRIVVLDCGKISAISTHSDLINTNEIYQSLNAKRSKNA